MRRRLLAEIVDLDVHPLRKADFRAESKEAVDETGALLLRGFLRPGAIDELVDEANSLGHLAFHSTQTHTVYLEQPEPERGLDDARSRAMLSTKGAVTTDLVPETSALHTIYESELFREFLSEVLDTGPLHEYADPLSSINVNYFGPGQELGWHFDNSAFAVTLLLQEPEGGGQFEYIDSMRATTTGDNNELGVAKVLDGDGSHVVEVLTQRAGDLALFRGRDALHRVTPVEGGRTRILVVLAYNTEPDLSLSVNARMTFFGRLN